MIWKNGRIVILLVLIAVGVLLFVNPPQAKVQEQGVVEEIRATSDDGGKDIYVKSLRGSTDVFIKTGNDEDDRYVGYHIRHLQKDLDISLPKSNYDVWNLTGVDEYSKNKYEMFRYVRSIVREGEWDLAIKEQGASDFVGGSQHGDEVITFIQTFADGEAIGDGVLLNKKVSEFKIVTESLLYSDSTQTEGLVKLGVHKKTYTFNSEGLTVKQSIEFSKNTILDTSYLAMLPILRANEGNLLTDTAISNGDKDARNISSEGFKKVAVPATKATISGKESGIFAEVEVVEKSLDTQTMFFVSNSSLYNKLYFSYIADGFSIKSGDTWNQTTKYKIGVSTK